MLEETLLLVDDDSVFLTLLQRSLTPFFQEIIVAESSEQAEKFIETTHIDKAVLDLNINCDSGLKLLQSLHHKQPNCQIIILTGYSSVTTAVDAMRLGAVNYLTKPANAQQILEAFQPIDSSQQITENVETQPKSVKRMEWEHIQQVLKENDGNISATARALNMHRRTLQRKLQKRPVQE